MHDFLSDIDKIQDDIEKDLAGVSAIPEVLDEASTPTPNFLLIEPPIEDIFDAPTPFEPPVQSFYRETIKEEPRKLQRSWLGKAVAIILIFTIGTGAFGFGLGAGWGFLRGRGDTGTAVVGNPPEPVALTTASYVFEMMHTEEVGSIADILELLVPSVVAITTHREEDRRHDFRPPLPPVSVGSGIIFAENEEKIFIATSFYVVAGGGQFGISITGSPPILAQPFGRDNYIEMAVLSIYKTQLIDAGIDSVVIASFGDSGEMRIGDAVFAIGNAMDDGISVTGGVISAPQRDITLPGRQHSVMILQTDAAINYGSSGGPLINTRGEIIGININHATASIFGPSPVEGMSYSIASVAAAPILFEIITAPPTPGIGVLPREVTEEMAMRLGIPALGVYVFEAVEGRGAHLAGMLPGDIITGLNGLPIFDIDQLLDAIRANEVGDIVEINVIRNGTVALVFHVELSALVIIF
ncbi:MAG: S1C family serine protease [Defluviitaleaceae bacterium]|nr:S1C family serine protease [Defluviitaleaceae bacterium]